MNLAHTGGRLIDFLHLFEKPFFIQSPGHSQGLAVIGNGNVLVSHGHPGSGHLLDRISTVGGRRMHVQVTSDIRQCHQVGQLAGFRFFNLPPVLSHLRGHE